MIKLDCKLFFTIILKLIEIKKGFFMKKIIITTLLVLTASFLSGCAEYKVSDLVNQVKVIGD